LDVQDFPVLENIAVFIFIVNIFQGLESPYADQAMGSEWEVDMSE
jgi:hypothetical protein